MFNPVPLPFLSRPYADKSQEWVRPYSFEETEAFLNDPNIETTLRLWDAHSGYAGLLLAVEVVNIHNNDKLRLQAYTPAEVFFDYITGVFRYRRSGRLVPDKYLALGNVRVSRAVEKELYHLTEQLRIGEISTQYWYDAMRATMRDQYRAAYIASIGGRANYTASEIAKFGWRVRPHYAWLDNFLYEIQSGKQPLNSFASRRAKMYARAGASIYQNNRLRVAEQHGFRYAKRVLGPTEAHCHDTLRNPGCQELADLGYVPMLDVVPIGDASCYSNCLCRYIFRQ